MLKAMVFIDFENYNISFNNYYKKRCLEQAQQEAIEKNEEPPKTTKTIYPKIDFTLLPQEIIKLLPGTYDLVKTYLFAPKPDTFLMKDPYRASMYNWINGLRNQDYISVIEGAHIARPVNGYSYDSMSLEHPESYYVVEKGTDVNLAVHVLTKGLHNAFDTAIIISGDSDYIPVLDTLNAIGKSVIVVGVEGQNLSKLKQHSDAQLILNDEFFQKCLRAST